MAEQILLEHCRLTGAQGATAVMSDPRNGEILAAASVVRQNEECVVPNSNMGLVTTFEPGSVIKPLVVAAATEEFGYTADTTVDVPSRIKIGNKSFLDHPEHASAPFPISEILAQSMNVGAIVLSQRLPPETFHQYLTGFGIGQASGMEFPESPGLLRRPEDWYGADSGSMAIGQGLSVNATQLLTAYNVLANGGRFVAPSLVRPIDPDDGVLHSDVLEAPQPPVVSPDTARELTRSLVGVVDHGTGRQAAVPGYSVAGKTGTAWKIFDDGSGKKTYGSDGNRRYVVSFVGYLPAENPQLSLAIVVDEPTSDTTASAVAAPIFSQVASYAARILPIMPTQVGAAQEGLRLRAAPARPVASAWLAAQSAAKPLQGDVARVAMAAEITP